MHYKYTISVDSFQYVLVLCTCCNLSIFLKVEEEWI